MTNLPPLHWLRAFEASARHLSFTHAAAELGLTQAAISKQVKFLELSLHEALFKRGPRNLTLTRAGAAYLPKVRDAFERLAAGTQEVFGNRRRGTLTLRASTAFAVNWLAPRLPDLFATHPKLRLRLISTVWNEPAERERYDLDIRYGQGKWPGHRSDRLTWEQLTPVCARALDLASPADLAHHRLLHVLGYEEGWAIWLRAAGLTGIDPGQGIQMDTSLMAFELAASGAGVALARSSLLAPALASQRLTRPFDLAVPVTEAFHLLTPEGPEHPDAETFRDWLLAQRQPEP